MLISKTLYQIEMGVTVADLFNARSVFSYRAYRRIQRLNHFDDAGQLFAIRFCGDSYLREKITKTPLSYRKYEHL
ncbi:hypothetical protein EDD73_104164 [Heliophilum fasciatum]|uniref:Uncharacterized protein n=1 Tax=Heliophilum fasciatum TaxID=35700 RepID=A0A4R2S797_9FIRM|nr:hypothetical protein [Heliophilum fasciatum]TCP68261.1 hypothetical protein EDD73_104164 [Heliophilum fasciatum]